MDDWVWNSLCPIKVWECAEASSGFVCDFQVCTGKRQDGVTEKTLGYLVVHDLTQNFTSKNHHIYCDNFFTSVSLAEDLLNDNIYLCGTTRAIRKDFPKELANNPQVKCFKQRESLFRRREDLVATVWKDKRFVNFLSTQVIRQGRKRWIESNRINNHPGAKCSSGEKLQSKHGRCWPSQSVAWLLRRQNKIKKIVAVSFLVLCGCKHC